MRVAMFVIACSKAFRASLAFPKCALRCWKADLKSIPNFEVAPSSNLYCDPEQNS